MSLFNVLAISLGIFFFKNVSAQIKKEPTEKEVKSFWEHTWAGKKSDLNGKGVDTWNRSVAGSEAVLADRRIQLQDNNLKDPYVGDIYPKREKPCSPAEILWRTADGSCNDLKEPLAGSAGVRFLRNVPLSLAVGERGEKLLSPNPRLISRKLMPRKNFQPVPFLNLMATSWIQFMVHDWFDHGENDPDLANAFQVPLGEDDPWLSSGLDLPYDPIKKLYYFFVPRTRPDLSAVDGKNFYPQTPLDARKLKKANFAAHQNVVTSWWDLSQIYGSNLEQQRLLRSENGKLKIREDGLLPTGVVSHNGRPAEIELTGFSRNWWFGLSLLHNLFVKEHNLIATELAKQPETKRKNNETDEEFDERIFQTARMVNSFVQAKIHTIEWTPAILANPTMYAGMHGNIYSFKRDQGEPKTLKEKLWRVLDLSGRKGITGRVGEKANNYGVSFSHSEEFVSIYRMHPLLPETFTIRDHNNDHELASLSVGDLRDENTTKMIYSKEYSLTDLMYSMGRAFPGQLVLNNYPTFLQNVKFPIRNIDSESPPYRMSPMDLAAIDIIRDRERGTPRYNDFRRSLHLRPIPDFRYLSPNPKVVETLRELYDNDVEKLDLFVGAMAESYRPAGFGFSETIFQLFVLMASRRLETDRFFTAEGFNEKHYTKFGFEWAKKRSMTAIILDHYPELGNALQGIENPFRPWNKGDYQ